MVALPVGEGHCVPDHAGTSVVISGLDRMSRRMRQTSKEFFESASCAGCATVCDVCEA